jgi:hypothetical protein
MAAHDWKYLPLALRERLAAHDRRPATAGQPGRVQACYTRYNTP